MAKKIDLERTFFKVAKDLETYEEVKEEFIKHINEFSEKWLDDKFRLGVLGLKNFRDNQ